jgi:hypothetical protein
MFNMGKFAQGFVAILLAATCTATAVTAAVGPARAAETAVASLA